MRLTATDVDLLKAMHVSADTDTMPAELTTAQWEAALSDVEEERDNALKESNYWYEACRRARMHHARTSKALVIAVLIIVCALVLYLKGSN